MSTSVEKSLPAYFGRYQVLEELGTGAMGVVYLCVDPRLSRPVAVKVLRESERLSPAERQQFRDRFHHEVEAAGRLSHPHIVQIFDIGPSFMVMEYVDGRTLHALLRGGGTLSLREVASIVLRVADALDYAHRNGIVHRDVKPANIMLAADGGVKVMDFGVARLESSNLTAAGTVVGSVRYMSPEQMMGEKVDGRADVFSLAAVAYEMLTGRPPFPGQTITEVVSHVVHGNHVPPVQVDGRLPRALNPTFVRAFAPLPKDRFGRAMDFARELHEALRGALALTVRYQVDEGSPTRIETFSPTLRGERAARPAAVGPAPAPSPPAGPPPAPPGASVGATIILAPDAAPRREGVLMLDSDPPRARVWVDGNPAGETPIGGLDVGFGRHVVRMEAEGREPVSAELDLSRERPLKAVTFTLPAQSRSDGEVRPGQLVPFGPEVVPPRRVSGALPAYPEPALERGLEGSPAVEVWVSETGDVIDLAIVESAGAALDGALLEAVARWRFTPPLLRGVPVSMRVTVQHLFRR
jgi:TonB family protein